jgi:hypothetical protein
MIKSFSMVTFAATLVTAPLAAQASRGGLADSLLATGAVNRAESLYYAAVRQRPRDPAARWALGRYLAERGALRVAATLLEEADQFGGEQVAPMVNADLAPMYMALGEYHQLLGLARSPLTGAERERLRWLDQHPTRLVAPDTIVGAAYTPAADGKSLGHMPIRVQGRTVDATIDAHSRGITLCDTASVVSRVRRFADPRSATSAIAPAAADSIAIGRLTYTNYPLGVAGPRCAGQAVIGLDVLARLAPTFDPHARTITLHVNGLDRSAGLPPGDELVARLTGTDLLVARAGGWLASGDPTMARMLGTRRWTFDGRRGTIRVEP